MSGRRNKPVIKVPKTICVQYREHHLYWYREKVAALQMQWINRPRNLCRKHADTDLHKHARRGKFDLIQPKRTLLSLTVEILMLWWRLQFIENMLPLNCWCRDKKSANDVLCDVIQRLCQGVLYFQIVIRFYGKRITMVSFTPTRKV
jgi:hypothetical protein